MNTLTILYMEHLYFDKNKVTCDVKFLVQWFIPLDQNELNISIKLL
jgi:hypothetical protein